MPRSQAPSPGTEPHAVAPSDPTAPADPGFAAGGAAGSEEGGMLVLGGPAAPDAGGPAGPATPPSPARACDGCGAGAYDEDGYCGTCGGRERDPRDHVEVAATPWAAGVCDRGVRHESNEDALALAAQESGPRGRRAAVVVCDGVSTAARSALASDRAARAALDVLTGSTSGGLAGVPSALAGALGARLCDAADAAAQAVADLTRELETDDDGAGLRARSNPSCTFVAAALDGDVTVVGSVGDSRAYWLPDAGAAQRLTTDDSWAEEQIRLGAPREQAEAGPQSHTITRWIGIDAPDHTPATATLQVTEPGWLLVCSDGLWNYASEAAELADVLDGVRSALPPGEDPLPVCRGLVDWANAQGGRDNITVALLRLHPGPQASASAPADDEIGEGVEGGGVDEAPPTDALPVLGGGATAPAPPADEPRRGGAHRA